MKPHLCHGAALRISLGISDRTSERNAGSPFIASTFVTCVPDRLSPCSAVSPLQRIDVCDPRSRQIELPQRGQPSTRERSKGSIPCAPTALRQLSPLIELTAPLEPQGRTQARPVASTIVKWHTDKSPAVCLCSIDGWHCEKHPAF
jgi:hypothetical protein